MSPFGSFDRSKPAIARLGTPIIALFDIGDEARDRLAQLDAGR
jgi:hypothetical protein